MQAYESKYMKILTMQKYDKPILTMIFYSTLRKPKKEEMITQKSITQKIPSLKRQKIIQKFIVLIMLFSFPTIWKLHNTGWHVYFHLQTSHQSSRQTTLRDKGKFNRVLINSPIIFSSNHWEVSKTEKKFTHQQLPCVWS